MRIWPLLILAACSGPDPVGSRTDRYTFPKEPIAKAPPRTITKADLEVDDLETDEKETVNVDVDDLDCAFTKPVKASGVWYDCAGSDREAWAKFSFQADTLLKNCHSPCQGHVAKLDSILCDKFMEPTSVPRPWRHGVGSNNSWEDIYYTTYWADVVCEL